MHRSMTVLSTEGSCSAVAVLPGVGLTRTYAGIPPLRVGLPWIGDLSVCSGGRLVGGTAGRADVT